LLENAQVRERGRIFDVSAAEDGRRNLAPFGEQKSCGKERIPERMGGNLANGQLRFRREGKSRRRGNGKKPSKSHK